MISGRHIGIGFSPAHGAPTASIRTGDQIPLDGTVVGGAMAVDESALTGEATPVAKAEGTQTLLHFRRRLPPPPPREVAFSPP